MFRAPVRWAERLARVSVPNTSTGLRSLALNAMATDRREEMLWRKISDNAKSLPAALYWDVLGILQGFERMAPFRDDELYVKMSEFLISQGSKLSTTHVLTALQIYERANLRPRVLYVELFNHLVRLSESMYADEFCQTLTVMARLELPNRRVIKALMRQAEKKVDNFRFLHLCTLQGTFGVLAGFAPEIFTERCRFEIHAMPINEVYETLLDVPTLEYSFRPFEELLRTSFQERIRQLNDARDVNMFAHPIRVLLFMHTHGKVPKNVLKAYCLWARDGTYTPNSLSQKRPTAQDLVLLQTLCNERDITTNHLQSAIRNFIASGGGRQRSRLRPRPIKYVRRRRYIRCADPCEDKVPTPVEDVTPVGPFKTSEVALVTVGKRAHGNVDKREAGGPRGPQVGWRLRYALQKVWRDDGRPNKHTLSSRKANLILVK